MSGDFDDLGQLANNLERLAEVPSQVATEASEGITKQLQQQFAQGTDSYGKPWAPLKPSTLKRGRRPPPLTDTGTMRDGTLARPMQGAGIALEVGASYGVFHQYGTKTMAARKILPEGTFPKTWSQALRDAAVKAIRKRLGR